MRKVQLARAVAAIVMLAAATGSWADKAFPQVSKQQFEVAPNVLLAGKLFSTSFAPIARQDIVVIDLRTAEENTATQAEQLDVRDVTYFNLPVEREITKQQVTRFSALLQENHDRQIVVHCASGNRAGMLWGAYLVAQGMSAEAAQKEVEAIVTKKPARAAIEKYAREHGVTAQAQDPDGDQKPFAEAHVILQISHGSPDRQSLVLDIANNLSKHYGGQDMVDIEIVAFGPGVPLLFSANNSNQTRILSLMHHGVRFYVCGNTLDTIERRDKVRPAIIEGVETVQTGVAFMIDEINRGFVHVQP